MKGNPKRNWAVKIKSEIYNHPLTIFIVLVVFFISSFFTILQGISWSINFYQNNFNWR